MSTYKPITFADPENLEQDDVREAAMSEAEDYLPVFRHEDGSYTTIKVDPDSEHANPREYDGNVTTLIQTNSRCIDIDGDDAGLAEARDRWYWLGTYGYSSRGQSYPPHYGAETATDKALFKYDREKMMRRYVAMFRPDIAYYADEWSAGESNGWGYITTDALERNFPENLVGDREAYFAKHDLSPQKLFDQEVDIYRQWAEGEVYGAIHFTRGEPIVAYGEQGAYVTSYEVEEDSCWGFLGYDDMKDITAQFTDSPVTEDIN